MDGSQGPNEEKEQPSQISPQHGSGEESAPAVATESSEEEAPFPLTEQYEDDFIRRQDDEDYLRASQKEYEGEYVTHPSLFYDILLPCSTEESQISERPAVSSNDDDTERSSTSEENAGRDKITEEKEEEEEVEEEEEENISQEKLEEEEEDRSSDSSISQVYSKMSPFYIKWAIGIKTSTKIINLTKNNQFEVFYATSHLGIIYDYRRDKMRFLPGHNSEVSSIAADASGRWLITADDGVDNAIIVWDRNRRVPCWSLYNIFPDCGTRCVQISQDARFLVAVGSNTKQQCKFFLWTYGRDQADAEIELGVSNGTVNHIQFNHIDATQFSVTTEHKVIFCQWVPEKKTLQTYASGIKKHKSKFGLFRETLFLDDNHTAITSTNLGYVIVWCDTLFADLEIEVNPGTIEKQYLKALKIHQSGITSLLLADHVIVSSSEKGVINFHDQTLGLLYYLPRYVFEPVACLSFNLQQQQPNQMDPFSSDFDDLLESRRSPDEEPQDLIQDNEYEESFSDEQNVHSSTEISDQKTEKEMVVPSDCTIDRRPIYVRDFIFLTMERRFAYVSHHRTKVRYFFHKFDAPILSMDCNPNLEHLALGNALGTISLLDYKSKRELISSTIANTGIQTIKYSPGGRYLLAGLRDGVIMILDPVLLSIKNKIHVGRSEVCKICFTSNERIFAYFDKESTVYVHKLDKVEKSKVKRWLFMGGYKSHYKPICDIMFDEEYEDDGDKAPRLFTIGEDRMLVEYDIKNMQPNMLKLKAVDRIEQTAIPQSFLILPSFGKKVCFVMANDEYKLKVVGRNTRTCMKTTLGPTADTPIKFMKMMPGWSKARKKGTIIYATERHIGLLLLPPTGNPFEGMGMVGHPVKITAISISHDFTQIFTTGSNECSLVIWQINTKSVNIAQQLGGGGLEPFMSLVRGGPNGFIFKEMEDFFYYSQIIHQGEHANVERRITKNLALCEIPDLFRSLGYYPTEYEIANILYESEHLHYEETGEYVNEISFEECVKIYLNHRPVNGISLESINKALLSVADLSDPECIVIEKEELYKSLEKRGEAMSHEEVVGYLCILLLPKDEMDPVPASMTLKDFADDVLGIDLTITEENVREVTHPLENKNG